MDGLNKLNSLTSAGLDLYFHVSMETQFLSPLLTDDSNSHIFSHEINILAVFQCCCSEGMHRITSRGVWRGNNAGPLNLYSCINYRKIIFYRRILLSGQSCSNHTSAPKNTNCYTRLCRNTWEISTPW